MGTCHMKVSAIVASFLMMGCAAGMAQAAGGPPASRPSQGSVTGGSRLLERDRLSTHSTDRLQDRTRDQTRDRLLDRDQVRLYDRDRLRDRDQDRIYGGNLMSAAERTRYEQRLHSLATEQERVQYRMQQQHEMQLRAEQRGVTLRPAPTEARIRTEEQQRQREREQIYGYSMMTPAEVGHYEQQMRNARTEQERARISSEHRKLMQERARERGEAPPK